MFLPENWAVRLLHKATEVVSLEKKIDITAASNRNIPKNDEEKKINHKIHWRNEKRIIGFGKGEGTRERFKMGRHKSRHLGSVSRGTAVAHFP